MWKIHVVRAAGTRRLRWESHVVIPVGCHHFPLRCHQLVPFGPTSLLRICYQARDPFSVTYLSWFSYLRSLQTLQRLPLRLPGPSLSLNTIMVVKACRFCRREVRRIDDSREHVPPFRILLDTDCRIRSRGIASLLVQSVGTLAPA